MKALTIKQPWAYCITDLDKRIENRSWRLPERMIGKVFAIHTSKKMDDIYSRRSAAEMAGFPLKPYRENMHLGCIVALAKITSCVTESDSRWFVGRYGFVLDDVVKLEVPIPARGQLGFWDIPAGLIDMINDQAQGSL